MTKLIHGAVRLLTLIALIYLILFGNIKRDRLIQLGIFVSVFCVVHNAITVSLAQAYFLPLIPFMNLIETTRLEWLARKGDLRRLSHYKEKVASFDQGLKEHVRFKEIGQNTASIVHDAINIAFSSDAYLNLMQRKIADNDAAAFAGDVQAARASNQRLLDLLTTYRNERLQHNPDEPLDLAAIIDDARGLTEHRMNGLAINFSTLALGTRVVRGDRVKLTMILTNLISNACDALTGLSDSWIKVEIADQDELTIVSVMNSGPKISADLQEEVFKPFFTTKPEAGGSGLGLKICRDYMEAMGGRLELNTDCEHTCFDIVLR